MEHTDFYDNRFSARIESRPSISKRILLNEVMRRIQMFLATEPIGTLRVLDVGCGAGHLVARLMDMGNVKITGIDITDKTLRHLRELWPSAEFKHLDFSQPQRLSERYDVVTAVEVIEHISDAKKEVFITNCWRALRDGGMLVITTPNKDRVRQIPQQYRTTQPVEDWLNISELRALLEGYFDDVEVSTCIWFFPNRYVDAVFKRLLYPFHMGLEQWILRPTELGGHIVASAVRGGLRVFYQKGIDETG